MLKGLGEIKMVEFKLAKLFGEKRKLKPPLEFRRSYSIDAGKPKAIAKAYYIDQELMKLFENAYLNEPLTRKGILKRSHDAIEGWLTIKSEDERIPKIFDELANRTDLKNKLIDLLKNSMVYGVGYLEIVYENDDKPPDEEPPATHIIEIALIDPKTIYPVYQTDPTKDNYGEILYYEQTVNNPAIKPIQIHKDRIIEFKYDTLGDGKRPVGVIEPMLHVIESKIALDKASGRIPKKVVSQIVTAILKGDVTQTELDEWAKALVKMEDVGRFVAPENVEIDVKELGKALDIKPYSEHLIYQIAGGVNVPYTVLLGAGAGTLSTSETNLRDYYSDLKDLQVRFTPIIRRLLDWELKLEGITPEYEVKWNEIYADEQSEANIISTKARAIDLLLANGVISINEAREMLNLPPVKEEELSARFGTPIRRGWYAEG